MILEIVSIILIILCLYIFVDVIEKYHKRKKRISMSFKEAIDLVDLPVVTFCNKDKKLNFLLDTGSSISQINESVLPLLEYEILEGKDMDVIGIEGNKVNTKFCEMTITYKDKEFVGNFCVLNLDDAFSIVKEESGVQVHGIIGSDFFQKYKYVLDFKELIAYPQ